jgi:hypothetical protein
MELNYLPSIWDPCIFIKKINRQVIAIVGVHEDDEAIKSNNSKNYYAENSRKYLIYQHYQNSLEYELLLMKMECISICHKKNLLIDTLEI